MRTKEWFASLALAAAVLMTGCNAYESDPTASKDLAALKRLHGLSNTQESGAVPLGSAANFAVLGGTTVTNVGPSYISLDLGVSPGTAITGFQPEPLNDISGVGTVTAGLGIVEGTIYAGGPVAAQAHNDAVLAYQFLVNLTADTTFAGVSQLDGLTFLPGVYAFDPSANLQVNGTVYLDFQGDNNALFVFQLGSTLVTMTDSKVVALNQGNTDCVGSQVYWAVGSSATIDGSDFIGSIVANTSISMEYGVNVAGRLWALNGAVTMSSDSVVLCSSSAVIPSNCRDFVTGGGWFDSSTFGVSGGIKHGKFWGQLSYHEHGKNGIKVKSTRVTNYIVIDAFTRQIEGIAKVNGKGSFPYTVLVTDLGEPSSHDTFSLSLSNGYTASGTLEGGNIQLHTKCGEGNKGEKENYQDGDESKGNKASE